MMMIPQDIDYKNNQFEYPKVTWIINEPSIATLIVILKEIRADASSVQSDLGGGEDGHLGLVCTPEFYQPYVQPENPGRLQLEAGLIQYAITQARDEYAEATQVFREVIGIWREPCASNWSRP